MLRRGVGAEGISDDITNLTRRVSRNEFSKACSGVSEKGGRERNLPKR